MADLRVLVGGDSTGFQQTLQQAKAEAKVFSSQIASQTNSVTMAQAAVMDRNLDELSKKERRAINKGLRRGFGAVSGVSSAAGYASPEVAAASGALTSGFFALKEISVALGVGMLKAAGAAAVFAFGIIQAGRLLKESYELYKANKQVTASQADAITQGRKVTAAYDKAILDAQKRGAVTEAQATKLRVNIRSGDYATQHEAFRQIRGWASGPDAELLKQLTKARIENMPGRQRDIASANFETAEDLDKLLEKRKKATEAEKQTIDSIMRELMVANRRKIAEINAEWDKKEEPKDSKKQSVSRPTRGDVDSLSQIGLYTRQYLATALSADIPHKQLMVLQSIDRNTKPQNQQNPFQ